MKKKLLSILLSLAMVITMMPMVTMAAFADDILIAPALMTETIKAPVLLMTAKASGNTTVKLSWTKADSATKYVVYGNKCGKSFKKLATVKSNKYTVQKIGKSKLAAHKFYKFKVVAYNNSTKLATSKAIHFITGKTSGKYANASKITATTPELTIEVGQTAKAGATVKVYKNKKHISSEHGSKLRYVSDNKTVATVSSKGTVEAIREGIATIYIQDAGGLYCKTIVKVEDNRDQEAFESYKQEVIAKCEALSKLTDTKGIKTKIADAKTSIEALTYDKTLTLDENKAVTDAEYASLVERVKVQRIKQGLTLATLTAITGVIIYEAIPRYTVKFDLNDADGTVPDAQIVRYGRVKKPVDPNFTDHSFAGWYKTKDADTGMLSDPWDFCTDVVTADMTLYAQWTRTVGSILETNNDIPESVGNAIPENAWVNSINSDCKAFVGTSLGTKAFIVHAEEGNWFSFNENEVLFRIDENTYKTADQDGMYIFTLQNGKCTSFEYKTVSDHNRYAHLNGIYQSSECIAAGTMISMPEGQQKKVEELELGDVVCTFDHETGKVSSAPVCFIWESKNAANAFTLTFEGGIEVTVIEEHGFYDKEEQKYVFINLQNAEEYIGHHFYNADSNSWLELKSCGALNDRVDAYAIVTSGDLNHMSNGMLSMCDGSIKMIANIFEYDDQMKFDEEKKTAAIDEYGLMPKEKIMELEGFIESDYDDYNLQYLSVAIGKGLITWEWLEAFSDYCVASGL